MVGTKPIAAPIGMVPVRHSGCPPAACNRPEVGFGAHPFSPGRMPPKTTWSRVVDHLASLIQPQSSPTISVDDFPSRFTTRILDENRLARSGPSWQGKGSLSHPATSSGFVDMQTLVSCLVSSLSRFDEVNILNSPLQVTHPVKTVNSAGDTVGFVGSGGSSSAAAVKAIVFPSGDQAGPLATPCFSSG